MSSDNGKIVQGKTGSGKGGLRMITVSCIDCNRPIKLDFRPSVGDVITCSSCGVELEVIDVEPVELDWVYLAPAEAAEDWLWWKEKSD